MASEQVSSFDLDYRAPFEFGDNVWNKRVMLFDIRIIDFTESDVKDMCEKISSQFKTPISSAQFRVEYIKFPSSKKTVFMVIADAPIETIERLADKMKPVTDKLLKAYETGKKDNLPLNGIKCYMDAAKPLEPPSGKPGAYCFMVLPTMETLQSLGFDIELVEKPKTSKTPKPFPAATCTWEDMLPGKTVSSEVYTAAEQSASSAAAEKPVVTPVVIPPLAPAVERLFTQPESAKPIVEKIVIKSVNIDGFEVESDGKLIPCGFKGFKYIGATFLLINNEPIHIDAPTGFYHIK